MNAKLTAEEIQQLINTVKELKNVIGNVSRPPDQVIYDDVDLRKLLNVSKRTVAYWREKGLITFSKLGGKIYYRLSDILAFLKVHEVPAVNSNIKIAL